MRGKNDKIIENSEEGKNFIDFKQSITADDAGHPIIFLCVCKFMYIVISL